MLRVQLKTDRKQLMRNRERTQDAGKQKKMSTAILCRYETFTEREEKKLIEAWNENEGKKTKNKKQKLKPKQRMM